MKRQSLQLFLILATLSLAGVIVIQIFWLQKAYSLKEKQFNQSIHIALQKVAEDILAYNNNNSNLINPVKQTASNHFVIMVNDEIEPPILEKLIKNELEKRGVSIDFEYGIYDYFNETLVYGNYVNIENKEIKDSSKKATVFPLLEGSNYYFTVYFPTKEEYLIGEIDIWIFSSAVLLLVVTFFAYTLFVILKQKRLSEVKNDFINNMTHEFKTPISTISISSEVLMKDNITENPQKIYKYAKIINHENNRLKNQVERVLQLAVFNKEDVQLYKKLIDLHGLIEEVTQNMQVKLQQKQGLIKFDFDENPIQIFADSLHLSNIFYNLIDNAIKYSSGNPDIMICTHQKRKGVSISVADKGIGIPMQQRKLIFDKFYRVSTGNVHNVKGFGLGLNYVKLMVEAHKGTIRVESSPEEGSIFTVFLPNR